jgi:hypothetical protein
MTVMTDARERAIRDLTRHCGDGRLTLDELEERIDEVNQAISDDEIRHALRELPVTRADGPEPVVAAAAPEEPERVIPEVVLPPRRALGCGSRGAQQPIERTLKTVWVIAGFVALFNGFFWLAIVLWFVLPKLVLPNLRRI